MPFECYDIGDNVTLESGEDGIVEEVVCQDECCRDLGGMYAVLTQIYGLENHYGKNLQPGKPKLFYLIAIKDGQIVPLQNERTFPDGKSAAARAKELTEQLGYKVQPRRIAGDLSSDFWRTRERTRLTDGTYIPLPDDWNLEPIADHFLHIPKSDESKVEYTPDTQAGVLGRLVITTPGRYLEKFYNSLSDQERKRYIAMVDKPDAIWFAKTSQEIEHVYLNGPRSCMSHPLDKYGTPEHPVRVYAGPDLQLAYLKDGDRITARALVWPEKKIYGRVYGDEARLIRSLDLNGFSSGSLVGARIKKKVIDDDYYLMPYIDYIKGANDPDYDDPEVWLTLSESGNIKHGGENGKAFITEMCPRLGDLYPRKNFVFVHGANQRWSKEAAMHYAVHLDHEGELQWWDTKHTVEIRNFGRAPKTIAEKIAFQSEVNANWYLKKEMVEFKGKKISKQEMKQVYTCAGSGEQYLRDGSHYEMPDGVIYSRQYVIAEAKNKKMSSARFYEELYSEHYNKYQESAKKNARTLYERGVSPTYPTTINIW